MSDELKPAAYVVCAYSSRRNYLLNRGDYMKTIREEPGKAPAKERAETLRQELAQRSQRHKLGWTHITCRPTSEEAS